MKIIAMPKKEFKSLKQLILPSGSIHTEGDLYEYTYKGETKVVKTIFCCDKDFHDQKIATIETLDTYKHLLPEFMYIPDYFISVNNKIKAFTIPKYDSKTLSRLLNNPTLPIEIHLFYLRKIGELLERLKEIRKNTELKEIYIGDLQESNILVNTLTKELGLIDLDSCRIGSTYSYTAKYLTPFSLVKNQPSKYKMNQLKGNGPGYIIPNENSDIYCYIMIILNYLTGNIAKTFSIDDFYEYLNLLNKIGINQELIYLIEKILTKDDNINPYEYLETISAPDIINAREATKKLRRYQ